MTKPILGGRPLKFESPDELKNTLQKYFDTVPSTEWTVTGLALLVGSRQLLDDYQERDDFSAIITEAKLLVENGYEIDLKKFGRSGTIFALKNFNWKDRTEQDVTSGGEKVSIQGFIYQPSNELINDHVQRSNEGEGEKS